jgi:hypothetical protein
MCKVQLISGFSPLFNVHLISKVFLDKIQEYRRNWLQHIHRFPRKRSKKQTTAENASTSTFIRKPEAATSVSRTPDDGHCDARNMLSSVCTTKQ